MDYTKSESESWGNDEDRQQSSEQELKQEKNLKMMFRKEEEVVLLPCDKDDDNLNQKSVENQREVKGSTCLRFLHQRSVLIFAPPMIEELIKESRDEVTLAKVGSGPRSFKEDERQAKIQNKITGPKNKDSTSSSSKGTKSQPKPSGKSVQSEEPVFEVADSDMPQDQEGYQGENDDELVKERLHRMDQLKKWLMTLTASTSTDKSLKDFDELMSSPIDFSGYILNGLKIKNLTQEILLGSVFRLLKDTHSNCAELEYDFEECYKSLSEKLDYGEYRNEDTMDTGYLGESVVRSVITYYTDSRKPDTTRPKILKRHTYNLLQRPSKDSFMATTSKGTCECARTKCTSSLMHINPGSFFARRNYQRISTWSEYLPKRRWSTLEKKKAHFMIKDINKLLKERRMMRSLKKFVGGRLHGTDLRLLQRTI
ncbi:hypothetical protein Tco_0954751 [Tanacetum coccineum]|uniref:Uncharacterized protein n=1 Tax=Tanacetum coccineum TaxID=301880 RepID=A0ABQ5E594_9ASTR